ncbi:hypothetical protein BHWA1_01384 [Brachyspira hyodysenteriae WA1]|uniref:Uncharacterized protein n=1 Tax=Brachyspira hyodysenteriae (strain ATCC 49526 / WA1) TaxID=565034 RepID=A0A3B6VAJ3_BRAHW|nr:hypothetical protein BHWA1_01384 [Brachyspira hyodysenteriae WA1]
MPLFVNVRRKFSLIYCFKLLIFSVIINPKRFCEYDILKSIYCQNIDNNIIMKLIIIFCIY